MAGPLISLLQAKDWLRVDTCDDDDVIMRLELAAEQLVTSIMRLESSEELSNHEIAKVAVLYTLAYWYEHREDADHQALTLTLRSMVQSFRNPAF